MSDYETAQDLFDALCAPFPADTVDWRVGPQTKDKARGIPLCYIDARVVADRLDSICGMDGWQCNYSAAGTAAIVCNLGIGCPNGTWVWKADGAGATDIEGEKGMLSDAFKRAAVRFGIGRYLYDIKAPWIELQDGKITEAAQKQLADLYEKAAQKIGWGERAGVQAYRLLLRIVQETVTQPSDVQAFLDKHKGMIPMLPVRMRQHLNSELSRIGGHNQEAA